MQISEITAFLENAYGVLNRHYFNGALPKKMIEAYENGMK